VTKDIIRIRGACQNNLKGLNLDLPLKKLIVITGVSGSGKSSLAFDTIYAEGQRRYIETFSPYARQFLDRMDKPHVDRIEGIPPAIAIDQTNPVRTSRSTVGTMTEINDHLKLLFAKASVLYCSGCGDEVRRDSPETIFLSLEESLGEKTGIASQILITFEVNVPKNFQSKEVEEFLAVQGYTRIHSKHGRKLEVIQDRLRLKKSAHSRVLEALEVSLERGHGKVIVRSLEEDGVSLKFSSALHCPQCDISYTDPVSSSFSFNSPVGACEMCRGFGRTIGIDYGLVIPDERKSIRDGAVKPFQTKSRRRFQTKLIRLATAKGIPVDAPWSNLTEKQKTWVLEGEGIRGKDKWHGVKRFFAYLERKSYRMPVRVLLSKYRSYDICSACDGARLKPESLLWRIGNLADAEQVLMPSKRFKRSAQKLNTKKFADLPGFAIHDVMLLPVAELSHFFEIIHLPRPLDEAAELLLKEIQSRLHYLKEVGLGYLTLDRQSRTLSGGEVQRINLTTALGTSLVNTLFVLDEPSIGLHSRDIERVVGILKRLRDAGNTLIVVEHDAQIMMAADRILDLGPGPGAAGGEIVFFGSPNRLLSSSDSDTARYLQTEKCIEPSPSPRNVKHCNWLKISGAAENNLKNIDVKIPLNKFVCVTGVSGSGKSTLIHNVLFNALAKLKGKPKDPAGLHKALQGDEYLADAVLVDQSPIGRTTRSNPASFVGALRAIRILFSKELLAKERGYTAGTFSFNSGNGRCPGCSGTGFERVEMQFLSDVYLRCGDCNGRRFRPEVLEVKLTTFGHGGKLKSISDVLDMTVREAMTFFCHAPEVLKVLRPLVVVGLEYLSLGQPVPTLSGGEAQRLKLAGSLAKVTTRRKNSENNELLFVLDEPTTGLHFSDVARLLSAFDELINRGHSVLVIEHNLDVINAADWIIDLGPEGGESGGHLIASGPPKKVMEVSNSWTGQALESYRRQPKRKSTKKRTRSVEQKPRATKDIQIVRGREHNLKNVNLSIPRDCLTVITGVSGSGKSTVAFDILFAEGQRRYLESLNAYARQFVQPAGRAEVDAVFGVPPTIAIEQRSSRGGRKSTVATLTEIYHFLRLLFVKLGTQYCPHCDVAINAQSKEAILAKVMTKYRGEHIKFWSPLVVGRKGYYTELASWAASKGYEHLKVDGVLVPTEEWPRLDRFKEHDIDLPICDVKISPKSENVISELLSQSLGYGKGIVKISKSGGSDKKNNREEIFSVQRSCPSCGRSFQALDPRIFSYNSRHGWCQRCFGTGLELPDFDHEQSGEEACWLEGQEGEPGECGSCHGQRLRAEALAVYFQNLSITDFSSLSIKEASIWLKDLKLKDRDQQIARDLLEEISSRLNFLGMVGLSYLSLDRAAPTLSGGEAQRIRLAAQLGSNLRGVCYILDEPSIGLHPRDNHMLLDTVQKLAAKGNTVVVVEHDEETIRRADHIIDLGPGPGAHGGEVVVAGSLSKVLKSRRSVTGRLLTEPLVHPMNGKRRIISQVNGPGHLSISSASRHNLCDINVDFPLGALICVTGVSGSGKSTLIRNILYENLVRLLMKDRNRRSRPIGCDSFEGWEPITRVLEVDQTPIGKTSRSCPATYVGIWNDVRRLFAQTLEARMRGYSAGRFSFNIAGGRCDGCEGQGLRKIEMNFLPDVRVRCERCNSARFNSETLEVKYRGKNIAEVLAMSVDEATVFFSTHPKLEHTLKLLQHVGLGYLPLGQQSPTLSGGEAQRLKLVTELTKARPRIDKTNVGLRHTLYVLDEPTIGLHMADVAKLIHVLHQLVDAGNTVITIEHNLDIIAEADWLIDMGPDGGDAGGRIVAQGPPKKVMRRKRGSHTAKALAEFFRTRPSCHREDSLV